MTFTAKDIKTCLMWYFRIDRNWISVDEAAIGDSFADVLVDSGSDIVEVEIKISRSDLFNGEKRKKKHELWKDPLGAPPTRFEIMMHYAPEERLKCIPNKYFVCVPEVLHDAAKHWVEMTNRKYGIILYRPSMPDRSHIRMIRPAKRLHDSYKTRAWQIAKKLCWQACHV